MEYSTTIGIDVSDRTSKICVMGKEFGGRRVILEEATVKTTRDGFRTFLATEWDGGCFPTHAVGEAGLHTYNCIGPLYVSFQGIAVSEIPCDENDVVPPTGYFTNSASGLFHGIGQGAGRAHWVREGNYWMKDDAYSGRSAGVDWTPGTLVWKVPIGWHRKNMAGNWFQNVDKPDYERKDDASSRPLLIGGRRDLYLQTREILPDGTFRSEKFGHWITRGTWCRIILDGSTVQWFKFH